MRNPLIAAACVLIVAGCASSHDAAMHTSASIEPGAEAEPTEMATLRTVQIYEIAPPTARPIGPISAESCDGSRDTATKRILASASERGANGITQLVCRSEGLSWGCLSTVKCEATALNVLPPPPPAPPAIKPTKRKKARAAKPKAT